MVDTRSKHAKPRRPPAAKLSFREYVQRSPRTNTSVQNFIAHLNVGGRLPDVTKWGELRFYLNQIGAEPVAFIARAAWRTYTLAQRPTSRAR